MLSVVRISGGLGNQMFQYAFYTSLLNKGKNVALDLSWYNYYSVHNGFELDKVFSVPMRIATPKESRKYGEDRYDFLHRLKIKLFPPRNFLKQKWLNSLRFQEDLYNYQEAYYAGYYQSEKYFSSISNEIRRLFIFKTDKMSNDIKNIAKKMQAENSISIHIRRGDYLKFKEYNGICDELYYKEAIKIVDKKIVNPIIYIFSDDLEWCKGIFGKDANYVEGNSGSKSYLDMYLISCCKHHIIANSSFSWWHG